MTQSPDSALFRAQHKLERLENFSLLRPRNWIPGPGLLTRTEFKAYEASLESDSEKTEFHFSPPMLRGLKLGATLGAIYSIPFGVEIAKPIWEMGTQNLAQGDAIHTILGISENALSIFSGVTADIVPAMIFGGLGACVGFATGLLSATSRINLSFDDHSI